MYKPIITLLNHLLNNKTSSIVAINVNLGIYTITISPNTGISRG